MERNVAPGAAAPYGHACAHCVRAKCKCVLRNNSNTCERCHRSGKDCSPAMQVRKGGGTRKTTSTARRAQLEDKLENLVTLLQTQNSIPTPSSAQSNKTISQNPVDSTTNPPASPTFIPGHFASTWSASESGPNGTSSNPGRATLCAPDWNQMLAPSAEPGSIGNISPQPATSTAHLDEGADFDLHIFRTRHLTFYPCIYISPDVTVEDLQRERPFVLSNIRAICTRSTDRQSELGAQIRESLARRVVVDGERSIDLLLGLLIHMSWTHHFARSGKPYMGILSNIARSLVSELRLDGPGGDPSAPLFILTPSETLTPPNDNSDSIQHNSATSRTYEERRALLASFTMSAMVSSLLRYECLRWGPEVEKSANQLARNPECHGDEVLAAIARISQVSCDAAKVVRRAGEVSGPVLINIKPLQVALEKIKASISPELLDNKVVLSYIYYAEIMVHEIALIQKPSMSNHQTLGFQRPQYLYASLEASKSAIENYLSFDTAHFLGSSFYVLMHCMHGVQILHCLSILDDPGWDRSAITQLADVMAYLGKLLAHLEIVHAQFALETGVDDSVWSKGVLKLRSVLPKWSAGLGSVDPKTNQDGIEFDPTMITFPDDSWYADIFSLTPWNA